MAQINQNWADFSKTVRDSAAKRAALNPEKKIMRYIHVLAGKAMRQYLLGEEAAYEYARSVIRSRAKRRARARIMGWLSMRAIR